MASILETKNGTWRAQVARHGVRRSDTFKTRQHAEQWASRTEQALMRRHEIKSAMADATLLSLIPPKLLSALESAPYALEDIVRRPFEYSNGSAVYFLIKDGAVIYVGQSIDVFARLSRHKRDGKDFDAFNLIYCEPAELDALEEKYIAALFPQQNNMMRAKRR